MTSLVIEDVTKEYSGESAYAYNTDKQKPFRKLVERHTILSLVEQNFGGFQDLHVADLGCGDGIYSRLAEEKGASKVIGIDVTPDMIQLAKTLSGNSNSEFYVANCFDRTEIDDIIKSNENTIKENYFDVIIANFLFNYATSEKMILSLLQSCYALLRPGGIIIGLNDNPDCALPYNSFQEHKFTRKNVDGFVVEYKLWSDTTTTTSGTTSIEFHNYITPRKLFYRLAKEIGFKSMELQLPMLDVDSAKHVPLNFDCIISPDGPFMCIHACK